MSPASWTTQPASVTLAAGATVTCPYTDRAHSSLLIVQIPPGCALFPYTTLFRSLPSPADGAGNFSITTATAGTAVSATFSNLTPGAYGVTETVPSDYELIARAHV